MVKWTWKEMLGKIHCERQLTNETLKFDLSIYNGTNCLCVIVYEFEEEGKEKYNFWTFFNDLEHAKRCLGVEKNYAGEYSNAFKDEWKSITLDSKFKESWKLAKIFSKAGFNVELVSMPF